MIRRLLSDAWNTTAAGVIYRDWPRFVLGVAVLTSAFVVAEVAVLVGLKIVGAW